MGCLPIQQTQSVWKRDVFIFTNQPFLRMKEGGHRWQDLCALRHAAARGRTRQGAVRADGRTNGLMAPEAERILESSMR